MLLVCLVIGYLLGSIPTSLIIGRKFFDTDIREHGSGNLGGTNASRVFGLKIGILVIFLDGLKAFISVFIGSLVSSHAAVFSGMMCIIGHCYPVFADFKGGKGVASTFGYFLALGFFVTKQHWMFLLGVLTFVIVLLKYRMVSLASIVSLGVATMGSLLQSNFYVMLCCLLVYLLVVYRHRENIERIKAKTERTIEFRKK